jgi:hypothetical protein
VSRQRLPLSRHLRRASILLAASAAAAPLLPSPSAAQNVTARTLTAQIPRHGELWVEFAPAFQGWDQRFGGPGGRTPLAQDFNGPLLSHLYPGPEAAAVDLNADAAALGYDPVGAGDVSLGTIDMGELNREIRVIPLRFELGFLNRFSIEASVPAVWTKAEPFFSFDSTGATVLSGTQALQNSVEFFNGLGNATDTLQDRLESGGVPAAQQAQAQALIAMSSAFLSAFQRRVLTDDLLPLASTVAGQQLLAYYAGLQQQFSAFGIPAPGLSLPDVATVEDLRGYLGGAFLQGQPLGATARSWTAGELEAGVRMSILDDYRPDSASGGVELRTTAGLLVRLPLRGAGALPFQVPGDFVGVPVGDGQRDLALTLYQDVRLASILEVNASATYGIQAPDQIELRPHPPDRPFAVPDPTPEVQRNLGNYVQARIAPHLALDPHVLIGAEYRYWHKTADRYTLVGGTASGTVSTLDLGTGQTRHRLGIGATFRPGGPDSGAELGFIWQGALAGRGRTTPAADLATFHIRVPARIF